MKDSAIQQQVDAIKSAGEKATKSKEAAIKFLIEAGILPPPSFQVNCDANVKSR